MGTEDTPLGAFFLLGKTDILTNDCSTLTPDEIHIVQTGKAGYKEKRLPNCDKAG